MILFIKFVFSVRLLKAMPLLADPALVGFISVLLEFLVYKILFKLLSWVFFSCKDARYCS